MTTKLKQTLYHDDREQQFVCIVWDGVYAKHVRLPKDIFTRKDAIKHLRENHGIKISR